jgi:Putative manganese efflux pump
VSLTRRLAVVLALNLALVTALVITGLAARSLAVLAAGAGYLADAAAASGAIILAVGGWYWLDPAVALSIAVIVAYHALTVGFALGAYHVSLVLAAVVIGAVSVSLSLVGLELGSRLGARTGERGELIGGLVLIGVGAAIAAGAL